MVEQEHGSEAMRIIGRYALHGRIASGGMATVHLGRLLGPVGFSRTVAIKRLHAQFAENPEFVAMFLDEARLAARIRHPNVIPTLDVVATKGELFLVMEYVHGDSLSRLMKVSADEKRPIPLDIISSIVSGVLHGLHAAHEAKSERGEPLDIVHRDVSPHNVLLGVDGIPRVLDFGVARAAGRMHETRPGVIKGKIAYMATEQLRGDEPTRRADVYAVGVVLWEMLTGKRLFTANSDPALMEKVLQANVIPPGIAHPRDAQMSSGRTVDTAALDDIVMRALSKDAAKRFATAREMALAIERCVPPASPSEVGAWVEALAGPALDRRAVEVAEVESRSHRASPGKQALMDSLTEKDTGETNAPARDVPRAAAVPVPESDQTTVDLAGSTHISSVMDEPRAPPARKSAWIAFALGAFAFVGAAMFALGRGSDTSNSSTSVAPAIALPSAKTEPQDSVVPSARSAPLDTPPPASAAPAVASSAALAPTQSAGKRPAKAPSQEGTKSPSPKAPAAECWSYDAQGIKRLNRTDPRCMK